MEFITADWLHISFATLVQIVLVGYFVYLMYKTFRSAAGLKTRWARVVVRILTALPLVTVALSMLSLGAQWLFESYAQSCSAQELGLCFTLSVWLALFLVLSLPAGALAIILSKWKANR